MRDVRKIGLSCRGVNNCFYRDTQVRETEEEDEDPEEEVEHPPHYTRAYEGGVKISA